MLNILLLLPIIVACNTSQPTTHEAVIFDEDSEDPIMESLEQSAEHLDNMIEMSEKMSSDMIIINQNLEAILEAVTECKNNGSC